MPVARLLGDEKKYIVDYWLDRLKDLPIGTEKPLKERLTVSGEGLLSLDLGDTKIADLSPLAGMPLGELNLTNCTSATDLAPLRGMPLVRLVLDNALVTSVEPLRGMKSLDTLQLHGTPVTDLSPLEGLQIHHLNLDSCRVSSLAPLRGMPLEELDISATAITDLSPLTGMPLKKFDAQCTSVQDFTPLGGLPLEVCWLDNTDVGDLGFLKGAPLKQLFLWGCRKIRNLAVLSEIPTLEVLLLPAIPSGHSGQGIRGHREAAETIRRSGNSPLGHDDVNTLRICNRRMNSGRTGTATTPGRCACGRPDSRSLGASSTMGLRGSRCATSRSPICRCSPAQRLANWISMAAASPILRR